MSHAASIDLKAAALLVLGTWATTYSAEEHRPSEKPPAPNIVLFLADDMTYTDLGCFGNPDVRTPHLDQLAGEGMVLRRLYNSAPTCSPLRQSLYTGLYPVRSGAHPNHSRVYDGVRSLPHHLGALGYRVAILGKRHEAPAEAFPFEMLAGTHGDSGKTPNGEDLPMRYAKAFIESCDGPWCLVVASNQPHTPWNRGDSSQYPPEKLTVPPYLVDTPQLRDGLSKYYAEISYMDGQVGQLLEVLDRAGVAERTAVFWLSEQGSQLPFGKWTCYEMGVHAAGIVRIPGVVAPGSISNALISYVDYVPTIVDLAGGKPSHREFDGRSFRPVLEGAESHNDYVFSTHTTNGIYHGSPAFAIRSVTDGEWLYVRNLHHMKAFENVITAKDKIFASWRNNQSEHARKRVRDYERRPAEELFNVAKDPWCLENLASAEFATEKKAELAEQLGLWMRSQGDRGDVTERNALERQPAEKPWKRGGVYAQQIEQRRQ